MRDGRGHLSTEEIPDVDMAWIYDRCLAVCLMLASTSVTLSPVTGLGQEAFITRNKDIPSIELYLKKGNVTLEVTMKESPGDEDKVKAIAKKALGRL